MTAKTKTKTTNKSKSQKGALAAGQNIVNADVWVMDETYFSDKIVLLLVISLKTTAIIGSCFSKSTEDDQKAYIYATEIEQVYTDIIDAGHNVPKCIHTDQKPEYQKPNILNFFEQLKISPSVAGKNENQVVESINNQIKTLIVVIIFEMYKKNSYFIAFLALMPEKFKSKAFTTTKKSTDKTFRDLLFQSDFFQRYVDLNIVFKEAINRFNAKKSQVSATSFTRITLTKLNNIILQPKTLIQGTKKSPMGQLIQTFNDSGYLEAAAQIKDIIVQDQLQPQTKMKMINDLVVLDDSHAPTTQQQIMNALVYIACQNQMQIHEMGVNKQMMAEQSDKIEELLKTNLNLSEQLKTLTTEQERQQQALQQKELARQKRLNRQMKPETQPFNRQMVEELIDDIKGGSFLKARLRCAFTLLTITGIRCEELRRLKVKQVNSLLSNNYCPITRQKRGPANLKAFLRDYGVSMLKQRQNDFALLIARKNECFEEKDPDVLNAVVQECYVFSSENKPQTPLSRAFFNNMLNKTLLSFSTKRNMQTIYTTHSFRHDFITELWRDSNDIEFVRQFMGHKKIQSTVAYIQDLPESERLVKLLEIDRAKANKEQRNKTN